MITATLEMRLHAPWVHSLKEKRMIVNSLVSRIRGRFNVAAMEVDEMDLHQIIVIGIACVAWDTASADRTLDGVIAFVERSTEAEILDIQREIK